MLMNFKKAMTTIFFATRQKVSRNTPCPSQVIDTPRAARPSLAKIVQAAAQAMDERSLTHSASGDSHLFMRPKPMLALLCLCYAQGIYASTEIEIALRTNQQLRHFCDEGKLDASVLSRFRNDNWHAVRGCLVTVLWLVAEQKIAEGVVTKANKAHIEQEANRRMIAAAFSDSECGWN
jgi:transposase